MYIEISLFVYIVINLFVSILWLVYLCILWLVYLCILWLIYLLVINLFVSILWLVYLLVYCDYLLVFFFFFEINIMINYKKCNHVHSMTHVMSKKLVISWNWFQSFYFDSLHLIMTNAIWVLTLVLNWMMNLITYRQTNV